MSAYILARVTPHTRRLSDVETRLRTIIGVMSQKGATNSRLFRILMGGNAGDMGIGLEFKNFHEALGLFMKPHKIRCFRMSVGKDGTILLGMLVARFC